MARRTENLTEARESLARLRLLLREQRFGVLSTCRQDGHPYASLVAIATAEEDTQLLFCTLRATRKFQNLLAEPRVAMLITNHENKATDLRNAAAVTALGKVEEAAGDQRRALQDLLLNRHRAMADFVRSPGVALLTLRVSEYYLVTRFQNVIEFHVEDGTLRTTDPAAL